MTLQEAIRINSLNEGDLAYETQKDKARAKKMGIEALKRCQELRKYTALDTYMPLPGETLSD